MIFTQISLSAAQKFPVVVGYVVAPQMQLQLNSLMAKYYLKVPKILLINTERYRKKEFCS